MELHNNHVITGITHKASQATNAYIKGNLTDDEFCECIKNANVDIRIEVMSSCECKYGRGKDFNQVGVKR